MRVTCVVTYVTCVYHTRNMYVAHIHSLILCIPYKMGLVIVRAVIADFGRLLFICHVFVRGLKIREFIIEVI